MESAAPKTGIRLTKIAERLTPTIETAEFHKYVGIREVIIARIRTHIMVSQFVGIAM